MKKLYISIVSALSVLSMNAQLTQANHAPSPYDNYQMYRCDSVAPGNSGASQLWDFSALTTHSNIVVTYTSIAATFTDYPGATIAVIGGTSNVSYYDSNVSSLRFYGGNFGIGAGATAVIGNLKYTSPAIRAAYPMSFNTTSTSAISGSISVTSPLSTSGTFTGTSQVIADGTGTLVLQGSGNTFTNVLRVKTSQSFSFTTAFANGSVQQETYDYYAQGVKFALFSIATATATTPLGTTTQTIVTRDKTPGITSIENQTLEANNSFFNVYPNPAVSQVNFSTNNLDAKSVTVFDITGKALTKINLEEGKTKFDVSGLSQGLYLYTINGTNQKVLKSGKLTVSH